MKHPNSDVSVQHIGQHIKKIYDDDELTQEATIKKFFIVQNEGARLVNREYSQESKYGMIKNKSNYEH